MGTKKAAQRFDPPQTWYRMSASFDAPEPVVLVGCTDKFATVRRRALFGKQDEHSERREQLTSDYYVIRATKAECWEWLKQRLRDGIKDAEEQLAHLKADLRNVEKNAAEDLGEEEEKQP